MNEFDITPYIVGVLGLFVMFLSTWLIPMIKSKTTLAQQEIIQALASTVVYAAEQLFGTKKGQEKLAYATERLQTLLKKFHIALDSSALRPYIEAAVKALKFDQNGVIDGYIDLEGFPEGKER